MKTLYNNLNVHLVKTFHDLNVVFGLIILPFFQVLYDLEKN